VKKIETIMECYDYQRLVYITDTKIGIYHRYQRLVYITDIKDWYISQISKIGIYHRYQRLVYITDTKIGIYHWY
jgi:DNA-binding transcriptional regulator WhiA